MRSNTDMNIEMNFMPAADSRFIIHVYGLMESVGCYVPTQLFLACTCVCLFLVSPVVIFRTGFPFVEYCSGSFRPCLQSDY